MSARTVGKKTTVKLTANFERNLEAIEGFLAQAQAPQAFDVLLHTLTDTVLPNLERFPGMGRLFLERTALSVEVSSGQNALAQTLQALDTEGELREYVMTDYVLLYARLRQAVYLLSIRHQRQLSFDFDHLWAR